MKLVYLEKPFPHFLIEDFYTEEETTSVSNELISLSKILQSPKETKSALEVDGTPKKQNLGIFISSVYKISKASAIFNAREKLFKLPTVQEISKANLVFCFYPNTNYDDTLVQFYKNGDYYKPHLDLSIYSFITVFLTKQKKYSGGTLKFTEFNYEVDLQHNHSIFFPSNMKHEVTKVNIESDNLLDSRISITTLLGIDPKV